MGIYITNLFVVWLFLLLARYIEQDIKGRINLETNRINITSKISIFLSFLFIWLVAGLRVNVGTDYIEYTRLFVRYLEMPWDYTNEIEPLFYYFNKVIGLFTDNYQWLFIISAFIIYFFYYKLSIKETRYFDLSIFLFIVLGFYTSTFNLLRQWIACSIVFFSYSYLFTGHKRKFFTGILVATLFHYSAAILFPLYFFISKVKSNIFRILVILISTIGAFLYERILYFISWMMNLAKVPVKYLIYIDSFALNSARFYVFPMICLIVYVGYLLTKDRLQEINKNTSYHINILILGYVISMLGQKLYLFLRLQFYFLPILIILIPNLVLCFKGRSKDIIYNVIVILGFLFMLYSLSKNGGEPLPYNSILNS